MERDAAQRRHAALPKGRRKKSGRASPRQVPHRQLHQRVPQGLHMGAGGAGQLGQGRRVWRQQRQAGWARASRSSRGPGRRLSSAEVEAKSARGGDQDVGMSSNCSRRGGPACKRPGRRQVPAPLPLGPRPSPGVPMKSWHRPVREGSSLWRQAGCRGSGGTLTGACSARSLLPRNTRPCAFCRNSMPPPS